MEIKGVDIFDPTVGEVRFSSDSAGDIACWPVDDDYDAENLFMCQTHFVCEAGSSPCKALKRVPKAEIKENSWVQHHIQQRPLPKTKAKRICIKSINYFGNEVQKVVEV